MRSVRRHWIGVSVAEGLETAGGHIIRQEPAEDFFRAELGKLKIATGRGWQIICIAVDAGRGVRIRDGEEVQQSPQLGKRGWFEAWTYPDRTGRW